MEIDKNEGELLDVDDHVPEISLFITTLLVKIFGSIPPSINDDQIKSFISNCLILCEKCAHNKLSSMFNLKDPYLSSIILNSMKVLSTQMSEFYELFDCKYSSLLIASEEIKSEYVDFANELAHNTYDLFEIAARQYFINGNLTFAKGRVSPDLAKGLEAISNYFNTV